MASTSAAVAAALSSLSIRSSLPFLNPSFSLSYNPMLKALQTLSLSPSVKPLAASKLVPWASPRDDIDTSFFDNVNPYEDIPFNPPAPPEGYVPPPAFDELPPETEDEIAAAYEEIYGPAYSGESKLGNDIYVMDAKIKKTSGLLGRRKREKPNDGFEERVVEVRRVTKVVKGGKKLSFRAIVVVGDKKGHVGVGVGKAKEVVDAIAKSAVDARRHIVTVPMTKYSTFPHRADGDYGAAKVMLRPASPGTGVIAGGSVRVMLEMAGVENALGKQLGSDNALNNARATVVAVQKMRQFREVALERGIPMEELWK
ncbi:30S ribosomal protein S5, chloroplastic [Cocos nucifera]|nr:30S ribosomal protein S5, chloroplastic [Cocos nucifera]